MTVDPERMMHDLGPDGPTGINRPELWLSEEELEKELDLELEEEVLVALHVEPGHRVRRFLEPGARTLDVYPLLWGRARLCVSRTPETQFIDDVFEYPSLESAVSALSLWDGTGDAPYGWDRHPRSGRRRPEGDATKEQVHE